jgi:hypothetical protein
MAAIHLLQQPLDEGQLLHDQQEGMSDYESHLAIQTKAAT